MSDAAIVSTEIPEKRSDRSRYPDEVISLAFELWAFKYARSPLATARHLLTEWSVEIWGPPPAESACARAVAHWAQTRAWGDRVRAAIASVAPHIDTQIIANNLANALRASVVMGDVLDGRYNASEGRTRAYACQIAFNHAGYDAASMLERIKEASASRGMEMSPAALASLSPDELADYAASVRRGETPALPASVPDPSPSPSPSPSPAPGPHTHDISPGADPF